MMKLLLVQLKKISDEVCPDEEYEQVEHQSKSICSVEVYQWKYELDGLAGFRAKIEEYFKSRTDVIQKAIKCGVENYGNNLKLVTEVKVKRGWIFFYGDPEANYLDLEEVRTLRHACKDLSNCDTGQNDSSWRDPTLTLFQSLLGSSFKKKSYF